MNTPYSSSTISGLCGALKGMLFNQWTYSPCFASIHLWTRLVANKHQLVLNLGFLLAAVTCQQANVCRPCFLYSFICVCENLYRTKETSCVILSLVDYFYSSICVCFCPNDIRWHLCSEQSRSANVASIWSSAMYNRVNGWENCVYFE